MRNLKIGSRGSIRHVVSPKKAEKKKQVFISFFPLFDGTELIGIRSNPHKLRHFCQLCNMGLCPCGMSFPMILIASSTVGTYV